MEPHLPWSAGVRGGSPRVLRPRVGQGVVELIRQQVLDGFAECAILDECLNPLSQLGLGWLGGLFLGGG